VKFKVGDTVTWTSQAGGNTREKTGAVVEIIPPNVCATTGHNHVSKRRHESYTVRIKGHRGGLYWPHVCHLKAAK